MMKKEFFKDFLDGVVIFLLVRGGIFEWVFYNGNMIVFLLKVKYYGVYNEGNIFFSIMGFIVFKGMDNKVIFCIVDLLYW